MAGIIFTKTSKLDEIVDFYTDVIGCMHWLSQESVEIIQHENFLIGFHEANNSDVGGLFTFFYKSKQQVDDMFEKLSTLGLTLSEPKENATFKVYNFFGKDIDGRKLEFQMFLHDLPPIC